MEVAQEQTRDFKGVWIPSSVWLNKELNVTEKVLYAEIDSLDGDNGCFASNEYFAGFLGVGERAIRGYISHLKDLGLIYVKNFDGRKRVLGTKFPSREEKNFLPERKKTSSIYNSIEHSLDKTPYIPQGGAEENEPTELTLEFGSTDGAKKADNVTAKSTTKKPSPPCDPAPPSPKKNDDFDAFWEAYPKCDRKKGKADCRDIWHAQNLSKVKGKLMKALEIDKASRDWAKNNGEYIPLPKTWLNKKRYEDVDESEVVTEEKVAWAAITFEEFQNFNLSEEWKSWKDSGGMPSLIPAWAKRTEKWVADNSLNIVDAVRL